MAASEVLLLNKTKKGQTAGCPITLPMRSRTTRRRKILASSRASLQHLLGK